MLTAAMSDYIPNQGLWEFAEPPARRATATTGTESFNASLKGGIQSLCSLRMASMSLPGLWSQDDDLRVLKLRYILFLFCVWNDQKQQLNPCSSVTAVRLGVRKLLTKSSAAKC